MSTPYISVILPVFNEQANLENLCARLLSVLNQYGKPYEVIFTNDGSTDQSAAVLQILYQRYPQHIRIIHLNGNYGQHPAIMAAMEKVRGQLVMTMDADLQNLPEDIPRFIEKIEAGYDVVCGYREDNQDTVLRRWFSKLQHLWRAKLIGNVAMKDQGCMLQAYRRHIVDAMVANRNAPVFINALALSYARNPTEIPVSHAARTAGKSHRIYQFVRTNFDLITNFSLAPLQAFTFLGIFISALSGLLVVYLLLRRLFDGPEVQGVFTLFTVAFFFAGLCLLGLGILGEYIGRIYQQVRKRPRFVIRRIVEKKGFIHES